MELLNKIFDFPLNLYYGEDHFNSARPSKKNEEIQIETPTEKPVERKEP